MEINEAGVYGISSCFIGLNLVTIAHSTLSFTVYLNSQSLAMPSMIFLGLLSDLNFLFCLALFLCSIYYELNQCVDHWARKSWCRGHKFLVDELFLELHQTYFSLCGQVRDPSLSTLIMLIAPSIIATLLLPLLCVHLTTWNTERSSCLGF
uniref:Uncharacterized protein n=1 Tax=Acanthochromis polyacanthus TaxID=80966 RepID=A0A3Q1GUS2_9TELE